MEGFLIRAVVVAIGLWLASKMGLVAFNSTGTLIAAALLLGVVNAFVRPIIIILTFPITLLTLGLFLLVINALMIMLVAWFLPGFLVAGFWSAVFAAIVVSLTSWIDVRLDRPARPDRGDDGARLRTARALVSAYWARLLAELEGRHSEAAVEPHFGAPVLVHARRLEDRRHRVARRKRDGARIGFRRVEKHGRARRASHQA